MALLGRDGAAAARRGTPADLLVVGLGNPGAQYALHRHNVGFMAVDAIAAVHGFAPSQKKFQGWLQEGRIGAHKVLLLKPATFMNESGRAVAECLRFYKLGADALTVFHDELDLAPFKVKVKRGGGAAGRVGPARYMTRRRTWPVRLRAAARAMRAGIA